MCRWAACPAAYAPLLPSRLIDIPLSNLLNSGINKVYIITQYNSQSLHKHLVTTYNMGGQ